MRIGAVVIRVNDLESQVRFWEAALGYRRRPGDGDDFALLRPPDESGPNLSLDRMDSVRQLPPRIHLDLYTEQQEDEVRRLVSLGARVVEWEGRPADADYVIMEDPEGNRFCVVQGGDSTELSEAVGSTGRRPHAVPVRPTADDESKRVIEWSKVILATLLILFVLWLAWTLIFREWEFTGPAGLLIW